MRDILRSPLIWIAAVLWGGFWVVAFAVPRSWLFDIVNALATSVGTGVCIAYWPGVRRSISGRNLNSGHYLVLGIVGAWFMNNCRHVYNWIWRYYDRPDDMINHPFVAFMVFALTTFGIMHLMAKDAIEGNIPRGNWVRLAKWITVGLALAGLVIVWLEPSPH